MALLVLIVVLPSAMALHYMRQEAESRVEVNTQNLAKTMSLTFDGILDSIDVALLAAADEIVRERAAGRLNAEDITHFLVKQQQRLPVVPYLRATDEQGLIVYGPGVHSPFISIADRDFFPQLRDSASTAMVVGKPVFGRVNREWVWYFARRIAKPDGSFGGVVYAVLKLGQVEEILSSVSLGSGGSISLRHAGWDLIAGRMASTPTFPVRTGDNTMSPQLHEAVRADPQRGTYRTSKSRLDGLRHTYSFEHSSKYGFNIVVGETDESALAGWRRQAAVILALDVAIVLLALGYLLLRRRAWQRQESALAEIRENQLLLRETQEIAGIGSLVYSFRSDLWQGSEVLDGILGIDASYPRDLAHLLTLIEPSLRGQVEAELARLTPVQCRLRRELTIRRHCDGSLRWVQVRLEVRPDADSRLALLIGTLQDITEARQAQDEIRNLAYYDVLTGLPNRRLLLDRLKHALALSARSGGQGALILIDLDNFKTLNDTRGHDVGDLLLVAVARRLVECLHDTDTVARLGGDEFVVMVEELPAEFAQAAAQAELVGEKIRSALGAPYLLGGLDYHSSPSVGITLFAGQSEEIDELMKRADTAMYQAKAAGRNAVRFFDPVMQAAVSARARIETDLRHAISGEQLRLHYQAQVDEAGSVIGVEALVRWQHPQRGLVLPAEFIPVAEMSGLILPLGHWVLYTACAQLAAWAEDPATYELSLAVNVSARQFNQPDFVAQILQTLNESGARPSQLKLELTEGLLLDNAETVIAHMTTLKSHGVGFSLDDFGTGYSSLSYLKRLPLDQLKIDRSFVREVLSDANDAAIVRTVVALGRSLGMEVVAEGVETLAQRDFLAEAGCRIYQGYLFSRPLPAAQFEEFLKKTLAAIKPDKG